MTFATWDNADKIGVTLDATLLEATATTGSAGVRGLGGHNTGKLYFEVTHTAGLAQQVGVAPAAANLSGALSGSTVGVAVVLNTGGITVNAVASGSTLGARATGDIIGIAVDLTAALIWFRVAPSGNWNGSGTANPATGVGGVSIAAAGLPPGTAHHPYVSMRFADSAKVTANFGSSAFSGTVPSGFASGWDAASDAVTATVTRAGYVAWFVGTPAAEVTRIGYEAWFSIVPAAVVTRIGREVWFDASATASLTRKRRFMVITS